MIGIIPIYKRDGIKLNGWQEGNFNNSKSLKSQSLSIRLPVLSLRAR